MSDKTVKDYVGFFNNAFLLYSLKRYDFSLKKQLCGPKKIYCIDNGLTASAAFSFSANIGGELENMVFCSFLQAGQRVYYYKTKNGLEVDFFRPDAIG
ncbi:MAG: ATP-binding protein [Deltaproteobacteria bacterium]|nr:ATP-binding protein [Deltaproteobacteria bacterium]